MISTTHKFSQEGPEGSVGDHRAGLGQFDEADHRGECRALDHLDQKPDGRWDRDAQRLRPDHVAHLLAEVSARLSAASHWPFGMK